MLVTGAGGSIGAELVRQIAGSRPRCLTMADHSELNLYEIDSTLRQNAPWQTKHAALVDVRDASAMRALFDEVKPQIVFHAAALKHVPLLETPHNTVEAMLTNVLGTMHVAELCAARGIELVLVSTDKAVNPTSVMGVSKRLAEIYVQALADTHGLASFAQVRFGNVIGSSGSVIPLFRRQIAQGGPGDHHRPGDDPLHDVDPRGGGAGARGERAAVRRGHRGSGSTSSTWASR